ncbi:MAG: hypothetical protein ACE5GX_19810 [Thermoanaerobaculia bacterium]
MDQETTPGSSGTGGTEPPRLCPSCGQDLSAHPYYQLVPSCAARILQRIAMALLPSARLELDLQIGGISVELE